MSDAATAAHATCSRCHYFYSGDICTHCFHVENPVDPETTLTACERCGVEVSRSNLMIERKKGGGPLDLWVVCRNYCRCVDRKRGRR